MGLGVRHPGHQLAGDRMVLLLTARGYAGVNSGRFLSWTGPSPAALPPPGLQPQTNQLLQLGPPSRTPNEAQWVRPRVRPARLRPTNYSVSRSLGHLSNGQLHYRASSFQLT